MELEGLSVSTKYLIRKFVGRITFEDTICPFFCEHCDLRVGLYSQLTFDWSGNQILPATVRMPAHTAAINTARGAPK
jgi:hypothetical protein